MVSSAFHPAGFLTESVKIYVTKVSHNNQDHRRRKVGSGRSDDLHFWGQSLYISHIKVLGMRSVQL